MSYFSPYSPKLKIAITGRNKDTVNYEKALCSMGISCLTTMDLGKLSRFDGLLLPGGGDITPAFFGQKNQGSRNIDVELDITQLQALELFVKWKRPVLGICKGMQIINVFFGGTIIQHIKESGCHAWDNGDKFHPTTVLPDSILANIYGTDIITNSAHHQAVGSIGRSLRVVQHSADDIVEGIVHDSLPILGVQWHPERMFPCSLCNGAVPDDAPVSSAGSLAAHTATPPMNLADGRLLFSYFLSLCVPAGD